MKSIINELWHGNIIPQEDSRTNSKEMKELLGYMARHHGDLEKSFSNEQKEHKIGKYGLLHRDYIKQHKRGTYTTLLTKGKLNAHLHEIDVQANSMVEAIVANLARERGIDEELKASDAIKWAAEMNNIKASAEEIVLREVIYQ